MSAGVAGLRRGGGFLLLAPAVVFFLVRRLMQMTEVTPRAADVQVRGVQKRYGATLAVQGASFDIERGHVLSLLGPSGY